VLYRSRPRSRLSRIDQPVADRARKSAHAERLSHVSGFSPSVSRVDDQSRSKLQRSSRPCRIRVLSQCHRKISEDVETYEAEPCALPYARDPSENAQGQTLKKRGRRSADSRLGGSTSFRFEVEAPPRRCQRCYDVTGEVQAVNSRRDLESPRVIPPPRWWPPTVTRVAHTHHPSRVQGSPSSLADSRKVRILGHFLINEGWSPARASFDAPPSARGGICPRDRAVLSLSPPRPVLSDGPCPVQRSPVNPFRFFLEFGDPDRRLCRRIRE
jgi:hypothetical protein